MLSLISKLPSGNASTEVTNMSALPGGSRKSCDLLLSLLLAMVMLFCSGKLGSEGCASRDNFRAKAVQIGGIVQLKEMNE